MRATVRGLRRWLRYVAGVLVLTGIVAAIAFPQAALNALQLPLLAVFSTTRMVTAYVFSLVFAIAYGHTAARTPIPIAMDGVSPFRPAIAMNAPSPGRWNSVPPAVKISLATRKNQPFVHERMEL